MGIEGVDRMEMNSSGVVYRAFRKKGGGEGSPFPKCFGKK